MQNHDVFISYAHLDNQNEWVSEFDRAFSTFLSTWLGRPANIWRDRSMGTGDYIWDTIEEHLSNSSVMVPILSPSYLNSEWCSRELTTFIETEKRRIGTKSSVFNVRRMPIEQEKIPESIRAVLENVLYREFFKKEESGKVRVLSPDRGDELRRRFLDNLEDLAQDVYELLQRAEPDDVVAYEKASALQPFRGTTIYLSEPSPDLMSEYLEIKRDFLNRGATILPASILESKPPTIEEYEARLQEDMKRAQLVVHFIGAEEDRYSGSDTQSFVEKQIEVAARHQNEVGYKRLMFLPKHVEPISEKQQNFLNHLVDNIAATVDLLRTSLDLKTEMEGILLGKAAAKSGIAIEPKTESTRQDKNPTVYLLSEKEDEDFARNISAKLFKKGCEVWSVSQSGESTDLIEEHKWYLANCDAAIVCWSKAKMFRVRAMMSEFVSIMDNGREKPFVRKGVLIDGSSPEKDNFMTHETVVRNEADLGEVIESLKGGRK